MAKWTEPIIDRTADDLLNRASKAFWNVADWVRVYGNMRVTEALANGMLSIEVIHTILQAPTIATIPTVAEINALIANIEAVRVAASFNETDIVPLKTDYAAGNGAVAPDYEDVNDWERDLALIRDYLLLSAEDLIYSGVSTCGQDRVWATRFHTWTGFVQEAASPVRRARSGSAAAGQGLTRQNLFRRY